MSRITSQNPLISIIMNCYNSEMFLKEAIDSVIQQTYKNWEIIFWDNNSSDNSSKIVKSFNNTKIKYFCSLFNEPLYSARNRAIEKCQGEFISFLDCDDLWDKEKLEIQSKFASEGHQIIFGGYQVVDKNLKLYEKVLRKEDNSHLTNKLLLRNNISIGTMLIKTKILNENKFDEKFNLLGDFDLWIRLSLIYRFKNIKKILEFSRKHSNNLTTKEDYKSWLYEKRYFYQNIFKHAKVLNYPAIFIFIFITELKGFLKIR